MALTLGVRILPAVLLVGLSQTAAPNLDLEKLATGPYAQMHMVLEKGFLIFDVDVRSIGVRLDEATAARVRQLGGSAAHGKVTEAILDGEDLFLRAEFKRDVSLDRWVSGVRDSLEKAWKAGLITRTTFAMSAVACRDGSRPYRHADLNRAISCGIGSIRSDCGPCL